MPSTPRAPRWWRRREVVGAIAASTLAAAGLVMAVTRRSHARGTWPPLPEGERIGPVTVVAVHPPQFGAIPIVLVTDAGTRFQVDVLARDDAGPAGVAQTETLALFVANHGDGSTATDEDQGLGVMALAERLARLDVTGMPRLSTMRERERDHRGAAFGVPLS